MTTALLRSSSPTSFDWTVSLLSDVAQLRAEQQSHVDTTSVREHIAVDIVGIIEPQVPGLFGLSPHGFLSA